MKAPEVWLRQPVIRAQALEEKTTLCKEANCPSEKKPTAQCDHFWNRYAVLCNAEEHLWKNDE